MGRDICRCICRRPWDSVVFRLVLARNPLSGRVNARHRGFGVLLAEINVTNLQ